MRPTFAEIDLRHLLSNYSSLLRNVERSLLGGSAPGLIAVIKADAYGHGLVLCGRALAEARENPWLGVTSVDEALLLRRGLGRLAARVLAMSGFFPGEEAAVLEHRVTPQVWENYHFSLLDAAARRAGYGPGTVTVHLEIDTGMSRQGVAPGEALGRLLRGAGFERDSPIRVDGVLTHFSSPEVADETGMRTQIKRFAAALEQLRQAGVRPGIVHAGNSANASSGRELRVLGEIATQHGAELLVRPGLALYGVPVLFEGEAPNCCALHPVLSWRTEISSLREVPAGVAVGYNETFRATRETRLALLPVGYADGYRRELSNRGTVLLRGRRVPVVGRVSMDQTIVNVSGVEGVELGEAVTLIGTQPGAPGGERIAVEEIAGLCSTIPYEILCGIDARVKRVAAR